MNTSKFCFAIAAALTFLGVDEAKAATIPIDLDARVNIGDVSDGQLVSRVLLAGDYSVSVAAGSWRFGDLPLTCNASGEDCGDGWQANYEVRLGDDSILTGYGSPTTYETPEASLAEAQANGARAFFLASDTRVFFGLPDRFGAGGDNDGVLSLTVTGPGLAAVPLPAGIILLAGGLAGLAGLKRRARI